MLLKEREEAKIVAEKLPVIKEIPVIDHELMKKLNDENSNLNVRWLGSLGLVVLSGCHCADLIFCNMFHYHGIFLCYMTGFSQLFRVENR